MTVELQHLRYFALIARYEHVTRAADELHVAQSALSRVIRSLEGELGVRLFDRVGRRLVLNANGRILQDYTERIFSLLGDMHRELQDANDLEQAETITLAVKVASKFLPEIIAGFTAREPRARFVIVQSDTAVGADKWDIRLDAATSVQEDEYTRCILREEICLAMPKNHPLAAHSELTLREVAGESFLGMQKGSSMNAIATEYCRRAGFAPRIVLTTDNPATLRDFMRLGQGIAFNPLITWNEVATDEFSLVPIAGGECCRYIHLHIRPQGYHSRLVLEFRDYLIEFFRALQERYAPQPRDT